MKSEASHSITMLKQKFDEIKRNINTIEQKQREFFSQGVSEAKYIVERPQRPASVNRFVETKSRDSEKDQMMRIIKDLEIDKQILQKRYDEVLKESEGYKDASRVQENKIRMLNIENQQLKIKLERYENQGKRPQSCIRDSKSPPKKNRVAFSKDLVSVYHIDDNIPLTKTSPLQHRGSTQVISNSSVKNGYSPFQPSPSDRLFEHEYYSKPRRIGLD